MVTYDAKQSFARSQISMLFGLSFGFALICESNREVQELHSVDFRNLYTKSSNSNTQLKHNKKEPNNLSNYQNGWERVG